MTGFYNHFVLIGKIKYLFTGKFILLIINDVLNKIFLVNNLPIIFSIYKFLSETGPMQSCKIKIYISHFGGIIVFRKLPGGQCHE